VRWAVRAALTLGVAASVAANILHANPNPISQAIAAWPPLALLITVELISRVPLDHRVLAVARLAATTAIAGIAAYVSYWHMVGVAARYGERGPSPYLLPLSVDGLIIVASISLVELAARIRAAETGAASTTAAMPPHRDHYVPPTPARTAHPDITPPPPTIRDAVVSAAAATPAPLPDDENPLTPAHPAPPPVSSQPTPHSARHTKQQPPSARRRQPDSPVEPPQTPADTAGIVAGTGPATKSKTAATVAYWRDREPHLRPADIAERIGKSERQVRRILATLQTQDPKTNANDTPVPALAVARR